MCIFVYKDINSQTMRKDQDDLGKPLECTKKWGQQPVEAGKHQNSEVKIKMKAIEYSERKRERMAKPNGQFKESKWPVVSKMSQDQT